ncbi:hypothetical protein AAE478_004974 [Parahypoxylon ruwenzoriense]
MSRTRKYYEYPGHVISVAVAFSVVDIVVVVLRFWARKVQRQPLKADDWLMIPATLVTVGIGIIEIYGISQKALAHQTEIPPGFEGSIDDLETPQLAIKSQIEWAYCQMLPLALGCIKASFLFFYMRVFAIQKKSATNKLLVGLIVLVVSWTLAFVFATLFECGRNFWIIWSSQRNFETRCPGTVKLIFTLCLTDFLTDIVILCIPIPLVLRLNLSNSRKIAISSVFLLGGGTVVASLIRFIMISGEFVGGYNITPDNISKRSLPNISFLSLDNSSRNIAIVVGITGCMYWGMVECGVGVFAACLPTIQFLFRKQIWEPAIKKARGISNSKLTGSDSNIIYFDQTPDAIYAKAHEGSSRSTLPAYPSSVRSDDSIRKAYAMWDGQIGVAS